VLALTSGFTNVGKQISRVLVTYQILCDTTRFRLVEPDRVVTDIGGTWNNNKCKRLNVANRCIMISRNQKKSLRPTLGATSLRNCAPRRPPYPCMIHGTYRKGCYQAMRLPINYYCNCILRAWVHQLQWWSVDQWLSGHRLAGRIKGGGCGWFRVDELGASAKVILVMDSSILSRIGGCIPSRVIWLAIMLFHGLRRELLPIGSAVVRAKWACDVLLAGNRHGKKYKVVSITW
jgi:hypothetical protein